MKKSINLYIPVIAIFIGISCQKNMVPNVLPVVSTDSITVVESIKTTEFTSIGASEIFHTTETYSYDTAANRTIVSFRDSGQYIAGQMLEYTETFQYDSQHRLSQFVSTNPYTIVSQIDFSYSPDGNLSFALIHDLTLGQDIPCNYSTTIINGQKTIMEYDTSGLYNVNTDARPSITQYTFDANNLLIHGTGHSTTIRKPGFYYSDTTDSYISYDGNKNYFKMVNYQNGYPDSSSTTAVISRDSTVYTREKNTLVLFNSFMNLYRNLYWFDVNGWSHYANAMHTDIEDPFYYLGTPIVTEDIWSFYFPETATYQNNHLGGSFQNLYDSQGNIIQTSTPFGYGWNVGKTMIEYTYTKIKK